MNFKTKMLGGVIILLSAKIYSYLEIRIFDSNINFFIFLLHLKYQKVKVF